jgi:hypothetical protein
LRTILLLGLVAIISWSGYAYWTDYQSRTERRLREFMAPTRSARCRVVFRGDAVGLARSGVEAAVINGTANHVTGYFVRMNGEWVVLRHDLSGESEEFWIPREQILMLRMDPR